MATAIFMATMICAVFAYFYAQRKAKIEMGKRFLNREVLDIERVCDMFCSDSGNLKDKEMTRELVEHVAGVLSISPSLLRPTDRFEFELKPPRGWNFDSDQNTLLLDLIQWAKKRNQTVDASSIKTLGDYVQAMKKVY